LNLQGFTGAAAKMCKRSMSVEGERGFWLVIGLASQEAADAIDERAMGHSIQKSGCCDAFYPENLWITL
jgi:hypothetical protein